MFRATNHKWYIYCLELVISIFLVYVWALVFATFEATIKYKKSKELVCHSAIFGIGIIGCFWVLLGIYFKWQTFYILYSLCPRIFAGSTLYIRHSLYDLVLLLHYCSMVS